MVPITPTVRGGMVVRTCLNLVGLGLALLIVIATGTWVTAKPPDSATFKRVYAVKEDSALGKANCVVCHAKMPPTKTELNPYGLDVQKVAKGKPLDEKILKAVENLDSDKDGAKNLVEIKAGTLPGDPKSKPAK